MVGTDINICSNRIVHNILNPLAPNMKQAIMHQPGKIEINQVPDLKESQLKPNEILLEIKRIGICGSDIHVFHGQHPATPYPVIQGHEYSGVVRAIGKNVKTIKPGMMATARPQLVCGKCGPCSRGQYNACTELKVQGFQAPGVAQDLFVIPEDRIVVLPAELTLEQGAMVEPAAVGAHCTSRAGDLKGKNIVVSGAGTIGNLVAQFALARGAQKVMITDVSDYRLKKARACGIKYTANVATENFQEIAKEVFGSQGFQVGFEAAGVQDSLNLLMSQVEKGGIIVILGVYSKNPTINMYELGEHELTVFGSMMYRHEDYVEAAKMLASGKLQTKELITSHFGFNDYEKAYHFIEEKADQTMKVMIHVND